LRRPVGGSDTIFMSPPLSISVECVPPRRGFAWTSWLASAGIHLACWGLAVGIQNWWDAGMPAVVGPRAAVSLRASFAAPPPQAPPSVSIKRAASGAAAPESRTEHRRLPRDRVPIVALTRDDAPHAESVTSSLLVSQAPRVTEVGPTAAEQAASLPRSIAAVRSFAARAEMKTVGTEPDSIVQATFSPPPLYPEQARRERREGVVRVRARVSEDGRVSDVRVQKTSGHSDLDRAAVEALTTWRFSPARRGGRPVARNIVLPFRFALQ